MISNGDIIYEILIMISNIDIVKKISIHWKMKTKQVTLNFLPAEAVPHRGHIGDAEKQGGQPDQHADADHCSAC